MRSLDNHVRRYAWWFCLVALAVSFEGVHADDIIDQIRNSSPQERAEAQAEVLADILDLDTRQTRQLVEVNLKYSKQVQQLIDRGVEDTVVFVAMQEYARVKDDEIKALLTKEQIKRYETHKANLRKIIEDVIQNRNR